MSAPRLALVLGDQLSFELASLRELNPERDAILMAEVVEEATYVPHHPQKIALIFSVDFAEHNIGVLVGGIVEHRREALAGAAPGRPEIDDHGVVVFDRLSEGLLVKSLGSHGFLSGSPLKRPRHRCYSANA